MSSLPRSGQVFSLELESRFCWNRAMREGHSHGLRVSNSEAAVGSKEARASAKLRASGNPVIRHYFAPRPNPHTARS
jgi:hypothetical protein